MSTMFNYKHFLSLKCLAKKNFKNIFFGLVTIAQNTHLYKKISKNKPTFEMMKLAQQH